MFFKFNNFLIILILILVTTSARSANDLKSIGKFKDWETFTITQSNNKICFAQSIPVLQAPKKMERDASRLFVTFRPNEEIPIKDEVSVTAGYDFNNKVIVKAKSGKRTYDFFSQKKYAWIIDETEEKKFIKAMKKASRVMIIGRTDKGKQTIDHYSLMGFSKAYEAAQKNCS